MLNIFLLGAVSLATNAAQQADVRFDAILMKNCEVISNPSLSGKFDQPMQFSIDKMFRLTAGASKPGLLGTSEVFAEFELFRDGQWVKEKPMKMDAHLDKTPSFESTLKSDPSLRIVVMPRLANQPKGVPGTKQPCERSPVQS